MELKKQLVVYRKLIYRLSYYLTCTETHNLQTISTPNLRPDRAFLFFCHCVSYEEKVQRVSKVVILRFPGQRKRDIRRPHFWKQGNLTVQGCSDKTTLMQCNNLCKLVILRTSMLHPLVKVTEYFAKLVQKISEYLDITSPYDDRCSDRRFVILLSA